MFGPKVLQKLQQKKYRQEYGYFLVEGKKGVLDAVHSSAEVVQLVATDQFVWEQQEFCQLPVVQAFFQSGAVLELPVSEFARFADTTTPPGIAAVVKIPQVLLSSLYSGQLIAVLEDIRDPGNLGTMIRTADWFGVDGLLLVAGADPYQPKVVRSSMGSIFHLPLIESQDIVSELATLKQQGFQILVTRPELQAEKIPSKKLLEKKCVIFGNEAEGTSAQLDALADESLTIPRFGQAESLNVAMSFGIVMYSLTEKKTT